MRRCEPNILITGTPGCGKTVLAEEVASKTGLKLVNVGKVAAENGCYEKYDEAFECHVLDDNMLLDSIEDQMEEGGNIVDYHGCQLFPERWFDVVFVLRTDNTILYDRLAQRNYSRKKLQNNIECEIFGVLYEEALGAYSESIVHQLQSNTFENLEENVARICEWVQKWRSDGADSLDSEMVS